MFRISRRLDYGLQLMIALASESENRAQSTASLAEKLQIPLPFLHQIGHTLMQAGMIKATPGPRGGLRISQSAESITVLQIVETLEGKISINPASEAENGYDGTTIPSGTLLWNELQEKITSFLSGITLNQISRQSPDMPVFSVAFPEAIAKIK